jgi:hypothetical protein
MSKLMNELKYDFDFIKSHSLQPKWYKVLKVFILLGFLVGYYFLFGLIKTTLFFAVFTLLSTLVHLIYRAKTRKWKQSWLDFVVIEEDNEISTKRIGKYYYSAIVINTILSLVISQVLT